MSDIPKSQEAIEYCERSYSSFCRFMTLPSPVDNENIQANYENSVLEVILPEAVEAREKKIKVSVK